MKVKDLLLFGILALLAISVLGVWQTYKAHAYPTQAALTVHTTGISSPGGGDLVEITKVDVQVNQNVVEGYSIQIRNNSSKPITAVATILNIVWSNDQPETLYSRMDMLIHGDLIPMQPGEERTIQSSGQNSVSDPKMTVKSVQATIDYVEFADKSVAGPDNSKASKRIAQTRQGSNIYKTWLLSIYQSNGQKPQIVITELLSNDLPPDAALNDPTVKQGAIVYKSWLSYIYETQGVNAVIDKLTQHS